MGFRTLVLLNNDRQLDWEDEWALGKKIHHSQFSRKGERQELEDVGGKVIQCCHTDTKTLLVVDHLDAHDITYPAIDQDTGKISGLPASEVLALLKQAAGQLGFNLTKKPKKRQHRRKPTPKDRRDHKQYRKGQANHRSPFGPM